MLLKSKVFWICAALIVCVLVFFGVVVHRATQPQEIIKVYKIVEPMPRKTSQSPADVAVTGQTPRETTTGKDATDTTLANFSDDATQTVATFTPQDDNFGVDEPDTVDAADASAPKLDAAAQAEDEDIAQQVAELYIKIPQSLQYRLDLWDQIEALTESYVSPDGGPSPLIEELLDEYRKLTMTIFDMSNRYMVYARDTSPFRPGGEFHDLFEQNGMRPGLIPSE